MNRTKEQLDSEDRVENENFNVGNRPRKLAMTEQKELRETLAEGIFLARTDGIRWADQVASDVKESYREIVDIALRLLRPEIEKIREDNIDELPMFKQGFDNACQKVLSLLTPEQTPEGGVG